MEGHVEFVRAPRNRVARLAGLDKGRSVVLRSVFLFLFAAICSAATNSADAQVEPTMLDPNLAVRTVVTGLSIPTSMAFLGDNDILVLEKATGRVQRVVNGTIDSTVLDLAVNSNSERGLLGITLHPDFPANPGVYLYWTESTTGVDTSNVADTPLLGNRVDRFVWDGSTLTFEQNLIKLRALQPANPPELQARGNHNGGVIRFGPDGKLYIFIGDVGRRGQTQNLPCGPTDTCPGPTVPDDQFGGPEPDDAHLTGVILRLNDDGSVPEDNPFFDVGAEIGEEVGANIQKIFSYGHRNGFGMAFDPLSGNLWIQENGDDSFSEINHVVRGFNGGWVQFAGPVQRIADFKAIETGQMFPQYRGLQQNRWSPDFIADTPEEALERLFMLPGSNYTDPAFSWLFEVAPAGLGFLASPQLGAEYEGNLFVGAAREFLAGGYLFRFKLTEDRAGIAVEDPNLGDLVADNLDKFDVTESESLLIGTDFGVGTDIHTGPNGNLFVLSLSRGTIYEIFRAEPSTTLFVDPTSVMPGDLVTATWSGIPAPTSSDWIGLYQEGTDDFSLIDWIYVSCTQMPGDPQADGSCLFIIPADLMPGSYELRLFSNDGFTRLAVSNPVTVIGGE